MNQDGYIYISRSKNV